jgi:hypothetical protein
MKPLERILRIPRAYQVIERPARLLAGDELPEIGDHLVTPWMGFAHHGIYAGEGKVVHYGALVYDIIRRPVEEVTLAKFAAGRAVFVVRHGQSAYGGMEALNRARSRLGEDGYRLLTNNCEHFVEWCLYDVARSFQVEKALSFPRAVGEWFQMRVIRGWHRLFGRRPALAAPLGAVAAESPAVPATAGDRGARAP